jgi:hypothetical protein
MQVTVTDVRELLGIVQVRGYDLAAATAAKMAPPKRK